MTSINLDGFILSQIPFLFGIITAAFPMIAVSLSDNKPRGERTRWNIQAILWLPIGLGATVLYYSMDPELKEPWDTVAFVSFLITATAFLAAFVVLISTLIYRRNHPEEYKKKNVIQPVIVIGVPNDHESEDPAQPESTVTDQPESKSVEHPEQPEPRLEDQPENAS